MRNFSILILSLPSLLLGLSSDEAASVFEGVIPDAWVETIHGKSSNSVYHAQAVHRALFQQRYADAQKWLKEGSHALWLERFLLLYGENKQQEAFTLLQNVGATIQWEAHPPSLQWVMIETILSQPQSNAAVAPLFMQLITQLSRQMEDKQQWPTRAKLAQALWYSQHKEPLKAVEALEATFKMWPEKRDVWRHWYWSLLDTIDIKKRMDAQYTYAMRNVDAEAACLWLGAVPKEEEKVRSIRTLFSENASVVGAWQYYCAIRSIQAQKYEQFLNQAERFFTRYHTIKNLHPLAEKLCTFAIKIAWHKKNDALLERFYSYAKEIKSVYNEDLATILRSLSAYQAEDWKTVKTLQQRLHFPLAHYPAGLAFPLSVAHCLALTQEDDYAKGYREFYGIAWQYQTEHQLWEAVEELPLKEAPKVWLARINALLHRRWSTWKAEKEVKADFAANFAERLEQTHPSLAYEWLRKAGSSTNNGRLQTELWLKRAIFHRDKQQKRQAFLCGLKALHSSKRVSKKYVETVVTYLYNQLPTLEPTQRLYFLGSAILYNIEGVQDRLWPTFYQLFLEWAREVGVPPFAEKDGSKWLPEDFKKPEPYYWAMLQHLCARGIQTRYQEASTEELSASTVVSYLGYPMPYPTGSVYEQFFNLKNVEKEHQIFHDPAIPQIVKLWKRWEYAQILLQSASSKAEGLRMLKGLVTKRDPVLEPLFLSASLLRIFESASSEEKLHRSLIKLRGNYLTHDAPLARSYRDRLTNFPQKAAVVAAYVTFIESYIHYLDGKTKGKQQLIRMEKKNIECYERVWKQIEPPIATFAHRYLATLRRSDG